MAQQTRAVFTTGLGNEIADINSKITTNITTNGIRAIAGAVDALVRQDEKDSLNTLFTNIKDSAFLPLTDNTDVITLEGVTNLWFTNTRARLAISETITGIDYNNATGVFSLTSGYVIPTTTEQTNWNTAYGNMVNTIGFSGTTITLTQQDSGTLTTAINLGGFTTDNLAPTANRRYLAPAVGVSAFAGSIGAVYSQAEVQALTNYVNSLRTALVSLNILS